MKKIIYLIALLAAGITACTEDFNHGVADPQSNDEEKTQGTAFTVALGDDLTGNVILGDYDVANDTIRASKVTAKPTMKNGTTLSYSIDISTSENFETYLTLPTDADGDNALVAVADLNDAVKTLFGKAPEERDVYVRTYVYINENTSAVRYDANIPGPAKITPATRIIETAYYLAINIDNITVDDLIPFKHSDQDRYVDPVFSLTLEVPANSELLFVPQSAYDMGANFKMGQIWGAEAGNTTDYEGELVTYNPGSILIEEESWVRITLNMEEYMYTVELLQISPYLYVPGDHQSWDIDQAPALYSKDMDMIYRGYMWLDGGFKFTVGQNWSDGDYGTGSEEGVLVPGGGNIGADPGFYYIEVNLSDLTYRITETVWGVIGEATPGGWDDDTRMVYDKDSNSWSATLDMTPGGYKFRANGDWDINVGGTLSQLVFNGDNLPVDTAGNYTITIYLSNDEDSYGTITRN